ncbi:hypothetical protein [Mucilaginibacter sp.]|uniref:hypothetical protein n=1 Tax=Mucilaginibacter sp. TaxID=1882438 RepID=UPI0025D27FD4|nr:hypothetical protein [Mucilaginibacter sp.]
MKILLTNWINLLGVFIATFAFSVVITLTDANLSYNIFQVVFAALFSVLGYGMMFWALFLVSLIILDLILIVPNRKNLKTRLLIEWLIISSPFIYWTVKYHEWIFVTAVIAFFISQQLREKRIIEKQA